MKEFREVVRDVLHFELPKEKCSYSVSTKTLKIIHSGPLKSEILLKKKEILLHLKGRLGEKSAPEDIV